MQRPPTTFVPLILAAALLAACAAHEHEELLGAWTAEDAESRRHTFTFEPRGRATWAVEGGGVDEDFAIRYVYDHEPAPHHLDLSGFERGPLQGQTLYCILEWEGSEADAFRLDCEPGEPTAEGARARPADFTDHTLVYMKEER